MSFFCFVPGCECFGADKFTQVADNRWVVTLTAQTPINELACFISSPLAQGQALACEVSSAPFEGTQPHYLGAITNEAPSAVFKTRYVWSAEDAVPTHVQLIVSLQPSATLPPAEKASTEVIEVGRRIGQNLYTFLTSHAVEVNGEITMKSEVLSSFER